MDVPLSEYDDNCSSRSFEKDKTEEQIERIAFSLFSKYSTYIKDRFHTLIDREDIKQIAYMKYFEAKKKKGNTEGDEEEFFEKNLYTYIQRRVFDELRKLQISAYRDRKNLKKKKDVEKMLSEYDVPINSLSKSDLEIILGEEFLEEYKEIPFSVLAEECEAVEGYEEIPVSEVYYHQLANNNYDEEVLSEIERRIQREILSEAMQNLDETSKKVIHLLFFEEKTAKEVAVIIGKSIPTVYYIKNKALEEMRKYFDKKFL